MIFCVFAKLKNILFKIPFNLYFRRKFLLTQIQISSILMTKVIGFSLDYTCAGQFTAIEPELKLVVECSMV